MLSSLTSYEQVYVQARAVARLLPLSSCSTDPEGPASRSLSSDRHGAIAFARVQCERLHERLVRIPLDADERIVGIPLHDVLADVLIAVCLVVVVVHADVLLPQAEHIAVLVVHAARGKRDMVSEWHNA